MVIYAQTDGEVVFKFLQSLVTDEQIAAAPSYYDKQYGGAGAFDNLISVYNSAGGLDANSDFDDDFFEEFAKNGMRSLYALRKAIKEGKFGEEEYRLVAHVLIIIRSGSQKILSRMIEPIKYYFDVEVYDKPPVDTIGGGNR